MKNALFAVVAACALYVGCPAYAAPTQPQALLYRVIAEAPGGATWQSPSIGGVTASTPDSTTQRWVFNGVKSGTSFRVMLTTPLTLPAGIQHIAFWQTGRDVTVKPIVTDSAGEEFVYGTRSQGEGWRYVSTLLINPYGGGAINSREIAVHTGGDHNGIPNGTLSLVGLEITTGALTADTISLRDLAFDMSKQGDAFDQWGLNGRYLKSTVPGASQPFVFASEVFRESGKYRVIWRAYDLSETRLLWQGQTDFDYDSDANTAAPADRVRFPISAPGTYILNVAVIDREADAGDIGARKDISYRLHILRGASATPPLAESVAPLGTLISINPVRHSMVYGAAEPKTVTVRVWKPTTPGPVTLSYWWRQGDKTVSAPEAAVQFGAASYSDQTVTLTGWDGTANPTATVGVQVKPTGAPVERREVTLGVASPLLAEPLKVSSVALTHDEVVKKYGNLYTVGNFDHEIFDCSEAAFETYVDSLQQAGYNCFIFRLTWARLNPLPGVGDFRVLDQRIAYLDKKQIPYILQMNWSFTDQPAWLDYDLMADQSGDTQIWQTVGKLPTASDTKLRAGIRNLISMIASRYLGDKNMIAYEFLGVGCDWLQPDAPYLGLTVDYSPSARAAFQRYLQDVRGETVSSINSRYGTAYKAITDVPLPSPNFTGTPDFSPQWRDFMAFKYWFTSDYVSFLAKTIRSLDQKRYISLYAMGGAWMPLPTFKAQGIYLANGGAEGEHQPLPRYSRELLYGIPDRSESVSCEFSSEIRLDSCAFNMMSIGGLGVSLNNFWRAGMPVYPGADGEKQKAYIGKWMKVLTELMPTTAKVDDIAIVSSPDLLFYDARTIFGDVAWFPEWNLGKKISNDENLRPQWMYEEDLGIGLPGKRMAVLLGQYSRIVEPSTIAQLVAYVKRGGNLVIDLTSGSTVPDPAGKPYALWRALGLPTPDSHPAVFDTKSTRYQTTITDGGGFWPTGGQITFNDPVYLAESMPGGKALIKDAGGRILAWQFTVGAGTVIAFPGKLDFETSAPFLGALYRKFGGQVPVTVSEREIKTAWLTSPTARYLVVHRYLGQGYLGDASTDAKIRALGSKSGTIGLNELEKGTYSVTSVISPKIVAPMTATSDELRTRGIGYDLCPGETAVYRITPAK